MRVICVSNRLPLVIEQSDGRWTTRSSVGGLVTALAPLLKQLKGVWVGWPGIPEDAAIDADSLLAEYGRQEGYQTVGVPLTSQQYEQFYQGFCNEIIWPLFHDLQSRCNFVPEYWTSYQEVKERFADAVQSVAQPDDLIWIHDYHLLGLAGTLALRGLPNTMAFFLHTPFPPPDIFRKLPWRVDVLSDMLHHRVIGFQTPRDLENFADCVRKVLPDAQRRQTPRRLWITHQGRSCVAGVFPIGIDFEQFDTAARSPSVSERVDALRANLPNQQVVLGMDRLDYTKGLEYRLRALDLAMQRFPDLLQKFTMLQVVIPSRETVPEYQTLKAEIEQLVSQINGKHTQPGWVPIQHFFRSLQRDELLAYYRLADAALVTPLKDGMNLVAKEYCACQSEGNGVLILSEFAGAAEQLGRSAMLVNPYDLESVADAIHRAILMPLEERRPRMNRLRALVRREDVYWWVRQYLLACGLDVRHDASGELRLQPVGPAMIPHDTL